MGRKKTWLINQESEVCLYSWDWGICDVRLISRKSKRAIQQSWKGWVKQPPHENSRTVLTFGNTVSAERARYFFPLKNPKGSQCIKLSALSQLMIHPGAHVEPWVFKPVNIEIFPWCREGKHKNNGTPNHRVGYESIKQVQLQKRKALKRSLCEMSSLLRSVNPKSTTQ